MARFGKRCELDGINFASEPERDFYIKLKNAKAEGRIWDFTVQPEFLLQEEFETNFSERWTNVKIKEFVIKPDYQVVLNDGEVILIDSKGGNQVEVESQLKRKIFLYQNREFPIFYVGQLPKYLGGEWVEVSKGQDFLAKLKTRYNSIYFKGVSKIPISKPVKWKVSDWDEHFEYEDVSGLFYQWKRTKRKVK